MNRLLIVGILIISTAPLFAQSQPDPAKLTADAQKVVSIISGDKAKTQAYCQINDLTDQIDEADQQKDAKKAEALVEQMNELEKQVGPEYLALLDATKDMDPNSEEGEEIASLFDKLDESCPH
jgi:ABC-type transporter Mla subunit MlaD